jgi:hypothetical protein
MSTLLLLLTAQSLGDFAAGSLSSAHTYRLLIFKERLLVCVVQKHRMQQRNEIMKTIWMVVNTFVEIFCFAASFFFE